MLDEAEPGSYRLTGDLKAPDLSTSVIQIQSDDVHLDLNGFAIRGQAGCSLASFCSPGSGAGIEGPGGNRPDPLRSFPRGRIRKGEPIFARAALV